MEERRDTDVCVCRHTWKEHKKGKFELDCNCEVDGCDGCFYFELDEGDEK